MILSGGNLSCVLTAALYIVSLIILVIFVQLPSYAGVKDYIEAYNVYFENKSYKYISEGLKGRKTLSDIEKYKILDYELERELDTKFVYADLSECIKIALEGNYDIKINEAEVLNAFWLHKNALVQVLPEIYYNYDISNLSGQYLIGGILAATEHEVPIQSFFYAEWPVFNKGKYFFYASQMNSILKAARFNLEFTKNETILNTVNAYYDLLSSKMQIEVQKINLYDRVEQLKYTEARFEAGIGTLYDVKRAQAETAGAQQDYTSALNTFRLEQAKLANIIGIDIFTSIYPYEIEIDKRELVDSSIDLESLYAQSLALREDIKAKQAEINAYRALRSSNYTDIIPAANITYRNGHVGTKASGLAPSNTITLDIRMSLGKNMLAGTITNIKAGSALVKTKKLELENLKRQIKEDILNSYYDSLNSLKKIEAAKAETEAADVSLDLSLENMKAGEATFLDVIASQNLKVKSNLNLIKNMIEYNKAQSKLLFDTGMINPENILKDYKTRY